MAALKPPLLQLHTLWQKQNDVYSNIVWLIGCNWKDLQLANRNGHWFSDAKFYDYQRDFSGLEYSI